MADVRSLLRSEQASRRISHPSLSYTRSGQMQCTVCDMIIKSASLWEGHLRSPNHRKNSQKAADPTPITNHAKKRKKDDSDEESRKRQAVSEEAAVVVKEVEQTAMTDRPKKKVKSVTFAEDTIQKASTPEKEVDIAAAETDEKMNVAQRPSEPSAVDEDEWAAFEREVAPLAKDSSAQDGYSATIVAAPVLASELPGQDHETKKLSKDVEADEEKEDDERRLEEELDVMEEMEERVRRLKEKRESLRQSSNEMRSSAEPPASALQSETLDDSQRTTNGDAMSGVEGESGDDDSDDDYDDWGFR